MNLVTLAAPSILQQFHGELRLSLFKVIRPIGNGPLSSVSVVQLLDTGRQFALKSYNKANLTQLQIRTIQQQAVVAGSVVDVPFIMPVYGIWEENSSQILILSGLAERGNLYEEVRRNKGKLPELRTVQVARAILCAVEYAHGRGLVHSNIKPENILFGAASDEIFLSDMGLSIQPQPSKAPAAPLRSQSSLTPQASLQSQPSRRLSLTRSGSGSDGLGQGRPSGADGLGASVGLPVVTEGVPLSANSNPLTPSGSQGSFSSGRPPLTGAFHVPSPTAKSLGGMLAARAAAAAANNAAPTAHPPPPQAEEPRTGPSALHVSSAGSGDPLSDMRRAAALIYSLFKGAASPMDFVASIDSTEGLAGPDMKDDAVDFVGAMLAPSATSSELLRHPFLTHMRSRRGSMTSLASSSCLTRGNSRPDSRAASSHEDDSAVGAASFSRRSPDRMRGSAALDSDAIPGSALVPGRSALRRSSLDVGPSMVRMKVRFTTRQEDLDDSKKKAEDTVRQKEKEMERAVFGPAPPPPSIEEQAAALSMMPGAEAAGDGPEDDGVSALPGIPRLSPTRSFAGIPARRAASLDLPRNTDYKRAFTDRMKDLQRQGAGNSAGLASGKATPSPPDASAEHLPAVGAAAAAATTAEAAGVVTLSSKSEPLLARGAASSKSLSLLRRDYSGVGGPVGPLNALNASVHTQPESGQGSAGGGQGGLSPPPLVSSAKALAPIATGGRVATHGHVDGGQTGPGNRGLAPTGLNVKSASPTMAGGVRFGAGASPSGQGALQGASGSRVPISPPVSSDRAAILEGLANRVPSTSTAPQGQRHGVGAGPTGIRTSAGVGVGGPSSRKADPDALPLLGGAGAAHAHPDPHASRPGPGRPGAGTEAGASPSPMALGPPGAGAEGGRRLVGLFQRLLKKQ